MIMLNHTSVLEYFNTVVLKGSKDSNSTMIPSGEATGSGLSIALNKVDR